MKNMMSISGLSAILLLLALGTFPGCGEKEDVTTEIEEVYSSAMSYTEEQMQAFREQTETKLAEYGKDIDQLHAKTENLAGDEKEKARQELSVLRQKRYKIAEKLKDLGSSSENAWAQLKSGVDTAMEDLSMDSQEISFIKR